MFSFRRIVLLLLFAGFFLTSLLGIFSILPYKDWYHKLGTCDESRIVRTMLWKEHEGLWARGGFIADHWDPTAKGCYRSKKDYQALQAKSWEETKADFESRPVYISLPGWGPLLYYPFWRTSQLFVAHDKVRLYEPRLYKHRLYIGLWTLRLVSSFSTALALWLLCLWMVRETNLFSGFFVAMGLMVFPVMPTLLYTMGRSPLYKPFFHFLPFLLVAFALQSPWRKRISARIALLVVAGLTFLGIVGKMLFGLGYDMLPPVMIAATIPIFWYAVRERWSWRKFSVWFGCCSFAALVGVGVSFAINGMQVEAIGKDFLTYAKNRYLYRSHGFDGEGNVLLCQDESVASWISVSCASHVSVVFSTIRPQLFFILLCAFCWWHRSVRKDLRARLRDARFLTLWRAVLVCLGIAAVAAVSQPLIWKQATAHHFWLRSFGWLLMFRPFALLALALLLEPALLRWSASLLERWRKVAVG